MLNSLYFKPPSIDFFGRGGRKSNIEKESLYSHKDNVMLKLSFTKDGQAITGKDLQDQVQENTVVVVGKVASTTRDAYSLIKAIGVGVVKGLSQSANTDSAKIAELNAKIDALIASQAKK